MDMMSLMEDDVIELFHKLRQIILACVSDEPKEKLWAKTAELLCWRVFCKTYIPCGGYLCISHCHSKPLFFKKS